MKGYLFVVLAILIGELIFAAVKACGIKSDPPRWSFVADIILFTAMVVWTITLIVK